MSVRKLSLAAVLAFAVAVTVAFAQPQVTVVLTNGQQYNGTLNVLNNSIGLVAASGQRMTWPQSSIAVIEFTPGQPSPQELQQVRSVAGNNQTVLRRLLNNSTAAAVLQNGQIVTGRLAAISNDGNQISLIASNGQQNNYFASDIARLYLNPSAAQNALAMNQQQYGGAVGTTGTFPAGQAVSVTVPANQPWTDTGIYVRSGERVQFNASGRIRWSPDLPPVGPEGGGSTPGSPVENAPGGALIGRVGNSAPFVVASGQIMTMPASGELMLGINDTGLSDNTGNFQVQIVPSGGF